MVIFRMGLNNPFIKLQHSGKTLTVFSKSAAAHSTRLLCAQTTAPPLILQLVEIV